MYFSAVITIYGNKPKIKSQNIHVAMYLQALPTTYTELLNTQLRYSLVRVVTQTICSYLVFITIHLIKGKHIAKSVL